MNRALDWSLLARVISGEATPAEQADVERWAASDGERAVMVARLREQWQAMARADVRDVDAAWARLQARLREPVPASFNDDDSVVPLAPRRRGWSAAMRLLPLAAVLAVAAGVAIFWRGARDPSLGRSVAATRTEERAGVGERRAVDLPDGSHVLLGAASSLRFDESAPTRSRDVYLQGQALFRVRHDSARRFMVHAGGTVTEDLGTEFDVRAYPGDSVVRVVVRDGEVLVHPAAARSDSNTVLHRNDVANVPRDGQTEVRHDQNVDRLLAWENGKILFDDTPLSDVAVELQRWFDIECRIADPSLRNLHLSAPFTIGQSIDEVLGVIEKSLGSVGLRVERQGRIVRFTRQSANLQAPGSRLEARGALLASTR
jgi:transmembrane sensor